MIQLTLEEIAKALDGKLLCGDPLMTIDKITTDSREKNGGLFIALKGENHDGHDHIGQFFDNGGKAVISHKKDVPGRSVILVNNTSEALLRLGGYYRSKFNIPVIGVTGSVGKTGTKDMVFSVMSQKYNTLKTPDNKNNEIGMPLTLLSLDRQHQAAVIEMGMNHFGEISRMTKEAKPNLSIITNIGTAHIGNLGSREGILKAKMEITEGMDSSGVLVLNGDDDMLWSLKGKTGIKTVYFGIDNNEADLTAFNIKENPDNTSFETGDGRYTIPFAGRYMVYNALAAIAAGKHFDVDNGAIAKGIAGYMPSKMRQETEIINGIMIISDCYNASVASVEASLSVMKTLAGGRKIAVLGDMLELGDYAPECHRQTGRLAAENGVDLLVCVGENSVYTVEEARRCGVESVWFDNNNDASRYIIERLKPGDTLLFKASRGMKFETIADAVTDEIKKKGSVNVG